MNVHIALLPVYLLVASVAIRLDIQKHPVYPYVKPLPILLLVCVLGYVSVDNQTSAGILVMCGLLFGMAGDILLTRERFFLPGLVSFLFGHIFYVIFFIGNSRGFAPVLLLFAVVSLLYGVSFYSRLPREKADMRHPVGVYMIVITLMVIAAANLHVTGEGEGALFVAGALCFFFSDCILAWHLMISRIRFDSLIVMGTYYAGQFCIASGMLLMLV